MSQLTASIAAWIFAILQGMGYGGVLICMAIQSACIPLPSEVILPFTGFLVHQGRMELHLAAAMATLGGLLGSWVAYGVGLWGGRPFLVRFGPYLLISPHDLDLADRWFARRGEGTVLLGRILPLVRSFISLPAGISRMGFWKFTLYTVIGLYVWNYALIGAGMALGDRWRIVQGLWQRFDGPIAALLVVGFVWYVWRHLRGSRQRTSER